MTTLKKQRAADASGFVDEVLNGILSASDDEIMGDDEELTENLGETADEFVKRAVQAAVAVIGKVRFEEAATELRRSQNRAQLGTAPSDLQQTKRDYLNSLKDAEAKLSLAARGATKVSKRDLDSAIEDLTELSGVQRRPRKK